MIKKTQAWFDRQNFWLQGIILVWIIFMIRTVGFGLYVVPTGSMETTMLVGERFFADKLTPWFTTTKRGDVISFNDPNFDYSDNTVVNMWQRYVWGPSNWTKRVIGIPGDHLEGKIEDGKPAVYRNGEKLDEPYLNKYPIIAVWTQKPNFQSSKIFDNARMMYFSYDPNQPLNKQPFYNINPNEIVHYPTIPQVLEPQTPLANGNDVFDVQLGDNEYWMMGDNRLGSYDSRGWGKLDGKLIHGKIKFCIFSLDSLDGWWIVDLLSHPIAFWSQVRWNRCLKFVK
jgi:signal peptidase I